MGLSDDPAERAGAALIPEVDPGPDALVLGRDATDRAARFAADAAAAGRPVFVHKREFSVFERLAQGANVNDIAQQLALSNKTISTHKARLMQKLNVTSLAELVKYAMEHKLV